MNGEFLLIGIALGIVIGIVLDRLILMVVVHRVLLQTVAEFVRHGRQ